MRNNTKDKYYIIEGLEIIDAGSEGKAVGKHDGLAVFVPYAVPGDVIDVKVLKKRRNYAEGVIVRIVKPSPHRITPICEHFGLCGGCKWQVMEYEQQLYYKQKQVEDNFNHLGKFEFPPVMPTIASQEQTCYRNKMEYTFTDKRWLDDEDMKAQQFGELETRGIGFHIPGKFDKVLDIHQCHLQSDNTNAIRNGLKQFCIQTGLSFYNPREHTGFMRNLMIRNSTPGDLMVVVVFGEKSDAIENVMRYLETTFPEITSLQYVINEKLNDNFLDQKMHLFKGVPFIMEQMEDLQFKIRAVSFYQTNSKQAYNLYLTVKDFAQIGSEDVVYDLYTGTGTIANFIARSAKKVIGIEYVEMAIKDAKENAAFNKIDNTSFFAGDMVNVLTPSFVKKVGTPNIIITDPPRAGMHPRVIEQLIEIAPEKIVYVSCNPATQARDITLLSEYYKVTRIQPVDMFPHTQHVENVALLERY
ncbi:MAG: 23S rRNA (uracil(1939)-C(5))-methyltransferase RlmD [Bacteroidales bacterium]|jgi:23S rRNA (uracil1939-C5)-methyltransferase|nr:23S rRNA (uracil(1939)-C(5))-methyltransferase RlmD [Bacteroidales bacterium]